MASVHGMAPAASQNALQTLIPSSSWIASLEYDPANLRLTTTLKSGAIYQHTFVTPMEWDALKTSQDHSKHWADRIRGKHLSVRVVSRKSPTASLKRRQSK